MTKSTEKLTNAELHQIIGSHEKGWAMIVPINYGYLAAKELLAVRGERQAGTSKIIEIAAELARGNLLGALWEEAEKSKNIRTERLQRLLENAGEAMKFWATQLKQTCERTGHPLLAVPQTDHLKRAINLAEEVRELAYRISSDELAPPAPAVPDDYFASLVAKARLSADKAMRKHPQPNYVLLKVAEEAGEVIQAGVHFAENRMDWNHVEGEIVQLMAMLIRLVTEGDQVNGIAPPDSCRAAIQENTPKAALSMAPAVNIGNMENTSGWIACRERMPTDETTVLVRNDEGVVWIADVDHGGQFYPDEFPVAKMSAGEITLWMPIPAAPTSSK